ncbi:hypothetical protein XAC3562_900047 [Xanthomonas citri pv. citri]|uniref:Uncharacterized protein n=1 Tax=Xanthomonas citri pv. citri TaxID=611301 RepID=A0A0U5BZ58_XANCI|nr:hypothetical protein XAC3562_900047 [Xanthomonas citri pv. citri]CEH47461.1 hypothetical protein XACLD7_13110002 [Xanthomonas citri pv. citri]CEH79268.1 hypothetical protein XACLH37_2380047 [Xanthomonas citri pv. citri]CEJ21204.1 hypothetical protein XACE116_10690003 [Xanthomonas citri pv. citri]CEJ25794.1 hypothetical protein XACE116_10690003 [Xanthomonas citri pv. citri]
MSVKVALLAATDSVCGAALRLTNAATCAVTSFNPYVAATMLRTPLLEMFMLFSREVMVGTNRTGPAQANPTERLSRPACGALHHSSQDSEAGLSRCSIHFPIPFNRDDQCRVGFSREPAPVRLGDITGSTPIVPGRSAERS